MQHLSDFLRVCIICLVFDVFFSGLTGSVVARLFGHKIGSDSEEENKTISVPDLFNHYPALEKFFLHQLQVDPQCKDEMDKKTIIPGSLLKPELFPVLTVFSKLRPSSSDLPER